MTLFLVIFVLESLNWHLYCFFKERKHGESCGLYWLDIAPAREKPQIKPYQNNLYALTHIKSTEPYQTLQIEQITKEKLSNFYTNVVQTIFFKEIFLLTIFFVDFLYADSLFYQNGTPR